MEAENYEYNFSQEPFLNKDSNAKAVELVWLWLWDFLPASDKTS